MNPHLKKAAKWVMKGVPYAERLQSRISLLETKVDDLMSQMSTMRASIAENSVSLRWDTVSALLNHLRPKRAIGLEKIRVGGANDGGYVMIDQFAGVRDAYSLGISNNVTWDLEIAQRGIRVFQFDFSVDGPPVPHKLFNFSQKRIERLADINPTDDAQSILKIDIEGSEWDFFANASSKELAGFSQILGEFHDLDRFHSPSIAAKMLAVFAKLDETHQLVHVHGNNFGPRFLIKGNVLSCAIELSYLRRSGHEFAETQESFPGKYDRPCDAAKPDLPLDGLFRL